MQGSEASRCGALNPRHYRDGKAGLGDYLILGKARSGPGRSLVTFDKKLAREDDVTLL